MVIRRLKEHDESFLKLSRSRGIRDVSDAVIGRLARAQEGLVTATSRSGQQCERHGLKRTASHPGRTLFQYETEAASSYKLG
jgi:hypothetical protein